MRSIRSLSILAVGLLCCVGAFAQEPPIPQLKPGSARKPIPPVIEVIAPPQMIDVTVPKGTPIQIALDNEVRLRKVGQTLNGRVVEPIYAFDKLVVPVGSQALGHITSIERPTGLRRVEGALDADFTPARKIHVEFTEIVLKDGRHIPVDTTVSAGSGQVLQFSSSPSKAKKNSVKTKAEQKTNEAKQQARQQWNDAMAQLKTPGRMHRFERYIQAQLPVHPQYIPAKTVYLALLNQPLSFGKEEMTEQMANSIGGSLPEGAVVHARLVTPLTSANAKKNDPVEAVLSQPLFDGKRLVLPEGSRLTGVVLQARPARRMKKNGQLRITFREIVPPDGIPQKVQATLEAVQAAKNANVKIDSEGGAEATNPKSRYLTTGLSLGLAAMASNQDSDANAARSASGDASGRAAGGAGGFKLIGIALGIAVKNPMLGRAMGVYGASRTVYSNFMTRGREVIFPENTAMDIGVGQHATKSAAVPDSNKIFASAGGN